MPDGIDVCALKAEAALLVTFWESFKADWSAVTFKHITKCMSRMAAILDGDARLSYPPDYMEFLRGRGIDAPGSQ